MQLPHPPYRRRVPRRGSGASFATEMKHLKPLLAVSLAAPALTAFALPALVADEVVFRPAVGSEVTKVFTNQMDLILDDMTMSMNGEEMDASMIGMEMELTALTTYVVTDEYVALGDGQPVKLKRTFDELSSTSNASGSTPMGPMDEEMDGSSELEGLSVVFAWDEEDDEYGVEFASDDEDDEELLEGLSEDMDLRALLPGKAVSTDDSWRIDLDLLHHVLAPGGNLKVLPDESDEGMGGMGMGAPGSGMGSLGDMLGELDGSAIATYKGKREVDGVTVGVIAIQIDITGANDMTEFLEEAIEDAEGMEDVEVSYDAADVELAFKGEGELLWNLAGGHLHRFELGGDVNMVMDMAMSMAVMGSDVEMEMSMEMSGTIELGAATRNPDDEE